MSQVITGSALGRLVLSQYFAGPVDHSQREPGEFGDLDTVALVRWTGLNFAKEDDAACVLLHGHVKVFYSGEPIREFGQFMIVRGEQRRGPHSGEPCRCSTTAQAMLRPS